MAQDPRALLQKADKMLQSASGGFKFFGSREDKYQEAADLYKSAANAFKMQKQYREAGQTFEKAAKIEIENLKEPDEAANTYLDAFKVYRNDSPDDAVRCADFTINRWCSKGNFRRAATQKETLGDMFENQVDNLALAQDAYEAAAGWYEGDGAAALANKNWLKVADLAAIEGQYPKAIENYEKVAQHSVNNNLMKYSVKDFLLRAGICHLAGKDMIATQRALEKYRDIDPAFATTQEHQLLLDIIQTIENRQPTDFADRLYAYDQMNRLDKWKTAMFIRIKGNIQAVAQKDDEDEFA